MFLLSFKNGLLYITYKNAIIFWLAKNVCFYCILPYKIVIGSLWGGGVTIYIIWFWIYYKAKKNKLIFDNRKYNFKLIMINFNGGINV